MRCRHLLRSPIARLARYDLILAMRGRIPNSRSIRSSHPSDNSAVNPILADPDGRIIAGHARLMAAKAMGLAEVPTIYIPGLSETQKRALRIADNKIALGAGWDLDVLKLELAELGSLDLDFDLSVTGFSTGGRHSERERRSG